jgi:hypothetical protein
VRLRSFEAAKAAWMVAMVATSAEEAGGGAINDGAMSAHVVSVWAGKPDSERRSSCCGAMRVLRRVGEAPGRGPRPAM